MTARRWLMALAIAGTLTAVSRAEAALVAHVLRDTDGDGRLNDCPNHDVDLDGVAGTGDTLADPGCTGTDAGAGKRYCVSGDVLTGGGTSRTVFGAIHEASARMTGPGDVVSVHTGTYGDIDNDGVVEQQTRIPRSGCAEDQDAVATVLNCASCTAESHRRYLKAADSGGVVDAVVVDLGNSMATAFATSDANYITIKGFHIIRQDMTTLYQDCNPAYSGTIGRRSAIEIYCPGGSRGDRLEFRDNVIDQQVEVMPPGDLSKKWHRGHVYIEGCGYATLEGNRMEGAVFFGIHSIYGQKHLTIRNNTLRVDNDTPLTLNDMAYGIYSNGNNGDLIEGNYIHRLGTDAGDVSAGLRLREGLGPDPVTVENNVIRGFRHCVYFQNIVNTAPGNVKLRNNTCVSDGTGTYGIAALVWSTATVSVRNNIFQGFESLFQGTPTSAAVGHNLVQGYDRIYRDPNNGSGVTWEGKDVCHSDVPCGQTTSLYSQCGPNAIADACNPDPQFGSTGVRPYPYYALTGTSPAVDAGTDADCGQVKSGASCDIGAYEYLAGGGTAPPNVQGLRRTDVRN